MSDLGPAHASTARRQTCTDHCSECGGHFHGLAAFDAHLHRVREGQNAHGARSCELDHLDGATAGLEVWTTDGVCELGRDAPEQPVTIWRLPLTEAARSRLARMAASRSGSSRSGPKPAAAGSGVA